MTAQRRSARSVHRGAVSAIDDVERRPTTGKIRPPVYVVGKPQGALIEPQINARLGPTQLGLSRVYLDGGLDAQALRFEGNNGGRTVGIHGVIKRLAGADGIGGSVEEPISGQSCSDKARVPKLGAAIFSCELAGLLWSTDHLGKLRSRPGEGQRKETTRRRTLGIWLWTSIRRWQIARRKAASVGGLPSSHSKRSGPSFLGRQSFRELRQ